MGPPAIDSGMYTSATPRYDFEADRRDNFVDMGADEFVGEDTQEQCNWEDHAPNPRFAIQEGEVFDKETGLIWEKSPSTDTMDSWESAITYCSDRG